MKALVLSDTSYSWRFATVYGSLYASDRDLDICSYTKAVFKGVCIWALVTALAMLIAAGCGDVLAWCVATIQYRGWILPSEVVVMMVCSTIMLGAIALMAFVAYVRQERKYKRRIDGVEEPDPGLIRLAYRSFKDKFCIPVTVVSVKE
jgi:hypothetical protein